MNVINKIISLVALGTIACCFSCKEHRNSTEHPILKVSLNEKSVSINELFDDIKIIPLTTSDEVLFVHTDKIDIHNDTIFIFDQKQYALYVFDPEGRFIHKIHKIGRGPQEYIMASDFTLNSTERTIDLLNPMGMIHTYDFDGTFVKQTKLPRPPMNYRYFEIMDRNNFITWSTVDEKGIGGINIFESENAEIINSFFPYSSLWGSLRYGSVFHKYKNEIYYHESLDNKVYKITPNGCEAAYEWDLGIRLINSRKLIGNEKKVNEMLQILFEELEEGKIPFFFGKQFQSDTYYYVTLRGYNKHQSLFYHKDKKEGFLFSKTIEGIQIDIKYMTDKYALGFVHCNDRKDFRNVVSKEDALLLDEMKDGDNFWLAKFIFPKYAKEINI